MRAVRLTTFLLAFGFFSLDIALAYTMTLDIPLLFPAAAILFLLNGVATVAAVLFLLGVQGFKPQFKTAYYYICGGYLLHAFGSVSYPMAYLGYTTHLQSILTGDIPLCLGAVCIYLGIRKFGHLLGLQGSVMSPWRYLPIFLLVAGIAWYLPHRPVPDSSELVFDLDRTLSVLETTFYLLIALLAFRIQHAASVFYTRPLRWFGVTFTVYFSTSTAINAQFYLTWLTPSTLYLVGAIISAAYLARGILSIIAGYSFNKISHREITTSTKEASLLDIIIFTASLASRPQEIDPILDTVRQITAHHQPNQSLNDQETHQLTEVYHHLEDYLTHDETIRSFTHDSLQSLLQKKFLGQSSILQSLL